MYFLSNILNVQNSSLVLPTLCLNSYMKILVFIIVKWYFQMQNFLKMGPLSSGLVLFTFQNYQCPVGLVAERSRSQLQALWSLGGIKQALRLSSRKVSVASIRRSWPCERGVSSSLLWEQEKWNNLLKICLWKGIGLGVVFILLISKEGTCM